MNNETKLTTINPVYDFSKVSGGYFELHFGYNDSEPFKLSFVPFLDRRLQDDEKLFDYIKSTANDKTVSHAIEDLYSLGFPVDDWDREYVEYAKDSVSAELFNSLIMFFNEIKSFGSATGSFGS